MRKVVIHRPGGHERLAIEEHPEPRPGPGEVLVAVRAAGVNYADCLVRMGLYRSAREFVGWPITPGFEFAGEVAALGEGTTGVAQGERVFGVTRFGAYAACVAVPRRQVFSIPPPLSLEEAAGFPAIFLTAYYPLHVLTTVRAGDVVLVHSAAGGVGSALVQLAHRAGARVVGVVGAPHKRDTVRTLGAAIVIDKSRGGLWEAVAAASPRGYDLVLDANGAETLAGSYRALAAGGRLVVYGFHGMLPRGKARPGWLRLALDYLRTPRFHPLRMTHENRSVLAFNLSYLFHQGNVLAEGMERLLEWVCAGSVRMPAVTRIPFERVAEAHRALESGSTVGKLVLVMDG